MTANRTASLLLEQRKEVKRKRQHLAYRRLS
nr:MAG TPA: hypothetical protein [Caudoviricetes sp.]